MIRIEFPSDRPDIAEAFAQALAAIGSEPVKPLTSEDCSTVLEHVAVVDEADGPAEVAGEAVTEAPTPSPSPSPAAASKVDEKGVAFNAAFCGESAEPFYATGKTKGQWKKRRGVEQSAYDTWYAGELNLIDDAVDAPAEYASHAPQSDAASAFGAKPAEVLPPAPDTAPKLMVWVSEKQSAGLLTQDQLNAAYAQANVTTQDLFGPNESTAVVALYGILSQVAGL